MLEMLRRVMRLLDRLMTPRFTGAAPLSGHYRATARVSQRG